MKFAVIVTDMLVDFITGSLKCDRAQSIVPQTEKLVRCARNCGVPVIYCNDAHLPNIDVELKLWGDHALAGTAGAQVIPQLSPRQGDYVVPKRRYSAFFHTDLDVLLRELGVDTLVVCGVQTHICVQHTISDAFLNGYKIILVTDATNSFTEEQYLGALDYIKTMYGAQLLPTDEVVAKFGE